ncbi:SEC-C domain-containing protein [Clostridium oceanicum]|uniref:SEC-C motif protein n=1 Tax=Clostridium oceanicum TaxID=1543 RepID=A0ABP3URU9_9CLOT
MKEIFEKITDRCLCGSGKKYVNCCKGKINPNENQVIHKKFMLYLDDLRRKYRKICLHPKSDECSYIKSHAHSISQKAVLNLIAERGEVLMPVVYGVTNEFRMKSMGVESKATKFYCFCSKHDGMFYDIDKRDVYLDEYTFFLYAYRNFAATYYKVVRELDCFTKLKKKYDINFNPYAVFMNGEMKKSIPALEGIKKKFDDSILTNKYDCLESIYLTLDYRVYFAASTCFDLMFDILGNRIEHAKYDLPMVYISIIPQEQRTQIIFSWFKEDNSLYGFLKEQLKIVPTRYVLKYLNNLLTLNCENMTVAPILWRHWSADAQNEFLKLGSRHLINENIKNHSYSYFETRNFNLFERIYKFNIE